MKLYFLDSTEFASDFVRVVHGGRGDYVELTKGQISVELIPRFKGTVLPENVSDEPFYYYWLKPVGREEKVYWQVKTVSYANYKIGYYYISPDYLQPFNENKIKYKSLFKKK